MAIGTPVENSTFGQTSITITGVPTGAIIIVNVYTSTGAPTAVADGQGSYTESVSGGVTSSGYNATQWYLLNANSGTHTLTFTSSNSVVYSNVNWYSGYSGINGTPTANDSNFQGTGSNAVVGTAITTSVANCLIVSAAGSVSNVGTVTAGTSPLSWTAMTTTYAGQCYEYYQQGAAGSVQATFTSSTNADILVMTIALAPSGGGGGGGATIAWIV